MAGNQSPSRRLGYNGGMGPLGDTASAFRTPISPTPTLNREPSSGVAEGRHTAEGLGLRTELRSVLVEFQDEVSRSIESLREDMKYYMQSEFHQMQKGITKSMTSDHSTPFSEAVFDVQHRAVKGDISGIVEEMKRVRSEVVSFSRLLKGVDIADLMSELQKVRPVLQELNTIVGDHGTNIERLVADVHGYMRDSNENYRARDHKVFRALDQHKSDLIGILQTMHVQNDIEKTHEMILSVQRSLEGQNYNFEHLTKHVANQHESVVKLVERVSVKMDETTGLTESNEAIARHIESQSEKMKFQLDRLHVKVEECRADWNINLMKQVMDEHSDILSRKLDKRTEDDFPKLMKILEQTRTEHRQEFDRLHQRVKDANKEEESAMIRVYSEQKAEIGSSFRDLQKSFEALEQHSATISDALSSTVSTKIDILSSQMNGMSDSFRLLKPSSTSLVQDHPDVFSATKMKGGIDDALQRKLENLSAMWTHGGSMEVQFSNFKQALEDVKGQIHHQSERVIVKLDQTYRDMDGKHILSALESQQMNILKKIDQTRGDSELSKVASAIDAQRVLLDQNNDLLRPLSSLTNLKYVETELPGILRSLETQRVDFDQQFERMHKKVDLAAESHRTEQNDELERVLKRVDTNMQKYDPATVLRGIDGHLTQMANLLDRYRRAEPNGVDSALTSVQKACEDIQHETFRRLDSFQRKFEQSQLDTEGTFERVLEAQTQRLNSQIDTLFNSPSVSMRGVGEQERVLKILDAHKAEQGAQFDRVQKRLEQLYEERRNVQADVDKVLRAVEKSDVGQQLERMSRKLDQSDQGKNDMAVTSVARSVEEQKANTESLFDRLQKSLDNRMYEMNDQMRGIRQDFDLAALGTVQQTIQEYMTSSNDETTRLQKHLKDLKNDLSLQRESLESRFREIHKAVSEGSETEEKLRNIDRSIMEIIGAVSRTGAIVTGLTKMSQEVKDAADDVKGEVSRQSKKVSSDIESLQRSRYQM